MTTNKNKKWITEINPKTGQFSASWPPIFSKEWTNNLIIALKESLFFSEIKNWFIFLKWKILVGKHYVLDINDPPHPTRESIDKALDEMIQKIKKCTKDLKKSTENEHVTRETLDKNKDKILEADHEIVFLPNIGIKLKIKK